MKSIRSFLLWRLLGGAALVLFVAGLAVFLVVRRSLQSQFDRNLTDRVQGFASLLFQHENEVAFEFSDELMPEYEREEAPAYFELRFEDGLLLERSNSLGEDTLEVPVEPSTTPTHWTAPLPDGRVGRFVAQVLEIHHVYPEEGPGRPDAKRVLVVIARGRKGLIAAERVVFMSCAAVALVLLGLLALLAWTAVAEGLAPAGRLVSTLDAIRADDLPEHLTVGPLPDELAPIAQTTDALIHRVDSALKRERRTTADIAHELRTPISEVLTVSEVALRNGDEPTATRRALETVRDAAWRMGRSVSTLLKLARLDMGAETFGRERVDLGALIAELLRSLKSVEDERGLRIHNTVEPGAAVEGDPEVLSIVVSNLLSNALHYSPRGGVVSCSLDDTAADRVAATWRLVVENRTRDLQPDDLPALAQPFWRKDHARADRDHSGLGLALSRALAEKAELRLEFELEGCTLRALLSGRAEDSASTVDSNGSPRPA